MCRKDDQDQLRRGSSTLIGVNQGLIVLEAGPNNPALYRGALAINLREERKRHFSALSGSTASVDLEVRFGLVGWSLGPQNDGQRPQQSPSGGYLAENVSSCDVIH